ncbi:unnamed protein product [marine sediment metagenome]|uniref:Calcineurin-like phosphoesterase domain-containing protein n=1 Tax=marine sediment metagenome TaxID=412755 RepID=X1S7B1_9ZZZZ
MKIGIISDSHDNLIKIRKAAGIFEQNKIEALIHAGDFCSPFFFRQLEDLKKSCSRMYAVFGNNDGDRLLLSRSGGDFCSFKDAVFTFELGGRKIVVMHYPDVAESLFHSGHFDLVIFGHTHTVVEEGVECKLLNPGACSGYLTERATVALFDSETMGVEVITL